MNFMTGLSILSNWKGESYDFILVIIDWLIKMKHYKPVEVIINASELPKVILYMVIRYHGLSNSIVTNKSLFFNSKFWLSLSYFLTIKQRLSTAFCLQIDDQTKQQKSTIESFLQDLVNFEQNNRAKLLPIAEFGYNNAKNASSSYISFELSCNYYF